MNTAEREEGRPPVLRRPLQLVETRWNGSPGRLIHTLPSSRAQDSAKTSCCKAAGSATNDA